MARHDPRGLGSGARHGQSTSRSNGAADQCGCGKTNGHHGPCEGGSDEACCGLECLVQPRFFCGQLLTDADLTGFLEWTKDRLRLARYRDGWGIVHGLDVRCGEGDGTAVVVTPGYAVTCCGNDAIVCEPQTVPLRDVCNGQGSPCTTQEQSPSGEQAQRIARAILYNQAAQPRCQEDDVPCETGEWGDPCVLDLVLRYRECPTAPQTVLRGGACGQTGQCEPSRTQESVGFDWRPCAADPTRGRVNRWCKDYRRCAEVIEGVVEIFEAHGDSDDAQVWTAVRDWLLSWVSRRPPQHFCLSREAICEIGTASQDEDGENPRDLLVELSELLTLLVLDCRLTMAADYAAGECLACDPAAGVALARVYAGRDATGQLRVAWIDPVPPWRRLLGRDDCWPACPGTWNLGRFIWREAAGVAAALHELGFRADCWELPLDDPGRLHEILAVAPIVGRGVVGRDVREQDCCPSDGLPCGPDNLELCVWWLTAQDGYRRVAAITPGPCRGEEVVPRSDAQEREVDDVAAMLAMAGAVERAEIVADIVEAAIEEAIVDEILVEPPRARRSRRRAGATEGGP